MWALGGQRVPIVIEHLITIYRRLWAMILVKDGHGKGMCYYENVLF